MNKIILSAVALFLLVGVNGAGAEINEAESIKKLYAGVLEKALPSIKKAIWNKKKTIGLYDLNKVYKKEDSSDYESFIESLLRNKLRKAGYRILPENAGNKKAHYTLGYSLSHKTATNYININKAYLERKYDVKINIKIISNRAGVVLWIKDFKETATENISFSELPADELDKIADNNSKKKYSNKYIHRKYRTAKDAGFSISAASGIGLVEQAGGGNVLEGGLGYNISRHIKANLNFAFFKYEFKRPVEDYEEDFRGHVFPVYVYIFSKIFADRPVSPYISLGGGMYNYVGEVEVPEEKVPFLLSAAEENRISVAKTVPGFNLGVGLKILTGDVMSLSIIGRNHWTGYEYGKNFQFLTLELDYKY